MITTGDFRKRGRRCRYHRHAAGEFECARCHQHFCPECAEEVSGHYYCSVCQHRLAARPAMAMPGMKQDAEQDIDKAGELGFDIDLLRRELEALEGTVVMTTAFWPLDSRGWALVAKGYTDISRQFISKETCKRRY